VLLARREERLRELAQELAGEYELCDVSDRAQVEQTATRIRERHPAVSLLVNNAGIAARSTFLDVDPERLEAVTATNYLAGVWCTRAFLPALEAGTPSYVANIVSVAGTVAWGGPYSASKHAQLAFSRSLGPQLRGRGIRVLTVLPGFVETEGFPQRGHLGNALLERLVVDPPFVAQRVVAALHAGKTEIVVPRWYRVASVAQALAPTLVARMARAATR
jgi:short-subunit dehydrogenase